MGNTVLYPGLTSPSIPPAPPSRSARAARRSPSQAELMTVMSRASSSATRLQPMMMMMKMMNDEAGGGPDPGDFLGGMTSADDDTHDTIDGRSDRDSVRLMSRAPAWRNVNGAALTQLHRAANDGEAFSDCLPVVLMQGRAGMYWCSRPLRVRFAAAPPARASLLRTLATHSDSIASPTGILKQENGFT